MTTLPGHLTSPTAGPLLCPQMAVRLHSGEPGVIWTVLAEGLVRVAFESYAFNYTAGSLVVPLDRALNLDACARWLARHHGLSVGATAPGWVRVFPEWWELRAEARHEKVFCELVDYMNDPSHLRGHKVAVPGISALTNPAAALRLACLAAVTP